jgi:hypothetical protein
MKVNWFQIVMLAYNLNCWLQLFDRGPETTVEGLRHTTLATARLRCYLWRHGFGTMLAAWGSATVTTTRRRKSGIG